MTAGEFIGQNDAPQQPLEGTKSPEGWNSIDLLGGPPPHVLARGETSPDAPLPSLSEYRQLNGQDPNSTRSLEDYRQLVKQDPDAPMPSLSQYRQLNGQDTNAPRSLADYRELVSHDPDAPAPVAPELAGEATLPATESLGEELAADSLIVAEDGLGAAEVAGIAGLLA